MRSGDVDIGDGRLRYSGINGYDWPSTASSRLYNDSAVPSAYYLRFNATGVYPSNGPYFRWNGFPPPLPRHRRGRLSHRASVLPDALTMSRLKEKIRALGVISPETRLDVARPDQFWPPTPGLLNCPSYILIFPLRTKYRGNSTESYPHITTKTKLNPSPPVYATISLWD